MPTRPRMSSSSSAARARASPASKTRCSISTTHACCTGMRKRPARSSYRRSRRLTEEVIVRMSGVLPLLVASVLTASAATQAAAPAASQAARRPVTVADVLAASGPADWRPLDAQHTLYVELPAGRVIIELNSEFAPHHVANIEALTREGYYDGLAIVRSQDNYVVQWADPDGKRPIRNAQHTLAAEFERSSRGVPFTPLTDPDTYAPEAGFAEGFPAARDTKI